MEEPPKIQTYAEFWRFYLLEHSHPINRRLHFIGTSLALIFLLAAVYSASGLILLLALLTGYGFAWAGHFWIEKNRPATFRYPWWSFLSDWRLWFLILTRRIR